LLAVAIWCAVKRRLTTGAQVINLPHEVRGDGR
jgi:hypothetical protein